MELSLYRRTRAGVNKGTSRVAQFPDRSGIYQVTNQVALDVDLSLLHPKEPTETNDWFFRIRALALKASTDVDLGRSQIWTSDNETARKLEDLLLERLAVGRRVLLEPEGADQGVQGAVRLTRTQSLIFRPDWPILRWNNGNPIGYYPGIFVA